MSVTVYAPAKLNLCLDITGADGGGYHLLDGVMLGIDLCDVVRVSLRDGQGISVVCDAAGIPLDSGNTAALAALAFFAQTGEAPRGLLIEIEKKIPSRAGLGGGSADAAAVLAGLDFLFGKGYGAKLEEIGLLVGADVPFCLRGGAARAKGRGELLTPLPMPRDCFFVIAKPDAGMSTRLAFEMYDAIAGAREIPRPDVQGMISALEAGDLSQVGMNMRNIFEDVICLAEVAALKAAMMECGALGAAMTGSGTAVAGLFGSRREASACADSQKGRAQTFLAAPRGFGPQIV